jgi:hypothetical protein
VAELGAAVILEFLKIVLAPDAARPVAQKLARRYGLFCLGPRVLLKGLPPTLPGQLFVSVHHRWTATPMDYQLIFAFLRQYDEVHVAIGLNTKALRRWRLGFLFEAAFGAIDLTACKTSDDKYWSLVRPFQAAVGRRIAVVVFPDIAGSTHWGDRSMTPRNGLYAAAVGLQVPILDVVHMEPTPACSYTSVQCRLWDARHTAEKPVDPQAMDPTSWSLWRRHHTLEIEAFRDQVHGFYVRTIEALETACAACDPFDMEPVCPVRDEREIVHNMTRNLQAAALGQKP